MIFVELSSWFIPHIMTTWNIHTYFEGHGDNVNSSITKKFYRLPISEAQTVYRSKCIGIARFYSSVESTFSKLLTNIWLGLQNVGGSEVWFEIRKRSISESFRMMFSSRVFLINPLTPELIWVPKNGIRCCSPILFHLKMKNLKELSWQFQCSRSYFIKIKLILCNMKL